MTTVMRAVLTIVLLVVTALPGAAQRPPRSELGRSVKLRILVDKVMQPEADWHTEEWMVAEAAAAGFNVWSPRLGNDDLQEVRQVTEWCRQQQIFHIPWMRGTLTAPEGPAADGRRVVWASGSEQPLWSPNSDELWDWLTQRVLAYAHMAAADSTLIGVFLDYENYASGVHGGHLYDLSYDDVILKAFAAAQGIILPDLALAQRKPWLQAQGLHDAFDEFQVEHWRKRCRRLRQAVDAVVPAFQFCIYPAPDTHFMTAATYPEWATPQAPLILADASIYGRPGTWAAHAQALSLNFDKLSERRTWALDQPGGPYMYAGGLDPVFQIWLAKSTPDKIRGVVFGWALTAQCVGWILAASLSGVIATFIGLRWIYAGGCFMFFLLVPFIAYASGTLMATQPHRRSKGKRRDRQARSRRTYRREGDD